eukprot:GFKZ01016054.1.p1 GENE.GFKZ01016054.1~~GFKZ01016054.1.p1  ORF type:complete len:692 (+),score=114.41 GFKZ01016054.1:38-2077(+)
MPDLAGSIHNLVHENSLKWIFVGGKGGVGKTTTSCSLAVALAATRDNVLLVSTDPAHNLSDAFSQKFSGQPTRVNGFSNLDAMEVEPPTQQTAPQIGEMPADLVDAVGGSEAVSELVGDIGNAIPGIDEAMAFGTLMKSVRDMAYDVVVFDTAPTGHTMRLLGFPTLLEKGLGIFRRLVDRFGPMASTMASTMGMPGLDVHEMVGKIESMNDVTREVSATFSDPAKCTFVCVCIPEFLSVFETERLVQEVGKFGISVKNIVVNQVIRAEDIADGTKAQELYAARMNMQTKYMEQIAELYGEDFHITAMPLLSGEVRGKDRLKEYSELLLVEKGEFTEGMEGMNDIGEYEGSLKNVVDDANIRWIFVGGKGGVGKTTTSSAVGVTLERKGKKVLLVSTDPAHNLSDAFDQKISSGTDPTKIRGYGNLFALEVNASEAAEAFVTRVSQSAQGLGNSGAGDLLSTDTLRQLLSSVPGIDEAVAFTQISKLAKSLEFDVVVFDTAPTGHTLRLLEFPTVADKALSRFDQLRRNITPMLNMFTQGDADMQAKVREIEEQLDSTRKGLQDVTRILNDQDMTTFICVAIAEFLSVYETERLVQELCSMNINVRNVLVNQLMPPKEKDVVGMLKARSSMQRKYLEQISELYPREDFHITYMPLLPMEVRGVDSLRKYGNIAIDGSLS